MGSDNGIVTMRVHRSVDETVYIVRNLLHARGIKLFTVIDHSGEAEAVGLFMKPTKLLIFGNPKAGTPLMTASPTLALDLPHKLLVWEDAQSNVWISYNAPAYLQQRHRVRPELATVLSAVETLAAAAAK